MTGARVPFPQKEDGTRNEVRSCCIASGLYNISVSMPSHAKADFRPRRYHVRVVHFCSDVLKKRLLAPQFIHRWYRTVFACPTSATGSLYMLHFMKSLLTDSTRVISQQQGWRRMIGKIETGAPQPAEISRQLTRQDQHRTSRKTSAIEYGDARINEI
nr:hypothetical protein CFP56_37241 [Quercus suber]